jgi:hypothetical protein
MNDMRTILFPSALIELQQRCLVAVATVRSGARLLLKAIVGGDHSLPLTGRDPCCFGLVTSE